MISLLPTSTPAETAAAYTLLAIIADPKAAKKRLDELVAEKVSLEDTMLAVRKTAADYDATKAETEKDIAARETDIDAREKALALADQQAKSTNETRAKQLDDHGAAIAMRQINVERAEADLLARESNAAKREEATKALASDVAKREEAATALSNEAQAIKDDYERKVTTLHAALSLGVST